MSKVTLDRETFKALASDTRLDILRVLDGKRMSLKDICTATKLNKATLHEHLSKLNEAGLIKKKEREGHKWVYYKLTWKGEGLLHPENTKIVIMFSATFISLLLTVMLLVSFAQPMAVGMAETHGDTTYLYAAEDEGVPLLSRSYNYRYIGEVDAKEQTVDNITIELQKRVVIKNNIGNVYDNDDIQWVTSSNVNIRAEQCILSHSSYYGGVKAPPTIRDREKGTWDMDTFKTLPDIINALNEKKMSSEDISKAPTDEMEELNISDDNIETGFIRNGVDGESFGFSPIVPEMIATVQDPTLLYFAIVCITFFGLLFMASTWKHWKNKTPKL